jgi:hypothetical protein
LIVLFYTVAQALPLLSFSFKAEESLYIFLLFIVDRIVNACTIIHEEKKSITETVVNNIDGESPNIKKKSKKKRKAEKRQKGKKQELEQLGQLELTRETDTVDNIKSASKVTNVKRKNLVVRSETIEYSEWQEKLIIKGINKVKNNDLGWRFTVADALRIRDELVDHGK